MKKTIIATIIAVFTTCCGYGQYVVNHSGLGCTYNLGGTPGVWFVCNLEPTLASPPLDQSAVYAETQCGLLICVQDTGDAQTAAEVNAAEALGRQDPNIQCKRGTDSAYTTPAPMWNICLDKDSEPAPDAGDCKEVGEVCHYDLAECCKPAVCSITSSSAPLGDFGLCCFNHGQACDTDAQCCAPLISEGCIDGVCACTPVGAACIKDSCCAGGPCMNGKCCINNEDDVCVLDSDCCPPLTCGALGFCND